MDGPIHLRTRMHAVLDVNYTTRVFHPVHTFGQCPRQDQQTT
jgi:hypothetical protein